MNFIVRWLITALAVAFTVWLVPGIGFATAGNSVIDVVAFAIVLALLNMAVKPILQALSLPITVLTFGLFYLVVNTAMLYWHRVSRVGCSALIFISRHSAARSSQAS